ncbi:MAG: efflux RND transporter periplasmic adaptor subunit [OM182 bacterium]|nr:MAG: efflux RND transporter periplasmic adaptor subunit [OM182 bacterium]
MIRTVLIPVLIVIFFLFGAVTIMATAPVLEPKTTTPIPISVRVQSVNPKTIQLKVHSQGTVMPSIQSQLIPEVSGKVVWTSDRLVSGGYVTEGQTLAKVDDLDYRNARDRAKAALERASAELQHAKFEYGRQESLVERNLTSQSALENSLRVYRVSQAAYDDARVNHEQAEENVKRTILKAPFTGLVRSENVDIGQFVSRGQPIATLYATDMVEVRLPIADRQLAFLNLPSARTGTLDPQEQPDVLLTAEYAGRALSWRGKIVRTEAEIDSASRMVQLVARIDNQAAASPLSVGLFVNAEIAGLAAENIVILPRSALRNDNQVLVVDGEDKLRFKDVNLLRLYQDQVLIDAGINTGDRVCVSVLQTAIEGMTVNAINDEQAGA